MICYVNRDGELDTVAPFIGDMTFAEHIQRVLEMPKVTAHLLTLPPISVEGHDVKSLTREVQEKMVEGLAQLHQKVLKPKTNYINPSSGSHERNFMPAFCHHFISGSCL